MKIGLEEEVVWLLLYVFPQRSFLQRLLLILRVVVWYCGSEGFSVDLFVVVGIVRLIVFVLVVFAESG